jgi:hypothetical protein
MVIIARDLIIDSLAYLKKIKFCSCLMTKKEKHFEDTVVEKFKAA